MPPSLRRPPEDEAALLARLRARDRAAFAELVARHAAPALRFARLFLRDPSAAEEVVQEAWVAVLTGIDLFEERSSLRTWLLRIVGNRARTRAARDGRTIPFSALAREEGGPAVPEERFVSDGHWAAPIGRWTEEDPERLALDAETRAIIDAAIAALPEGQRAVITLRDVEGLGAEEACNVLELTETNQRVLLHRARARVRAALEEHLGGARR